MTMEPFTVHRGLAAPLDRENVDTDAIIPKQFLKSIARTGFGPNLNAPIVNAQGQPVQDANGQNLYVQTATSAVINRSTIPGGLLDSWQTMWNNNFPTYAFGLSLSVPLRNRSAQADSAQALLQEREAVVQLQSLKNSIAATVRNAQIAMQQGLARVQAAVKATQLARETLDAEQKKFQLGVSTDYQVILRQRDLATAEGNEIQAKATLLEAIVTFNQALGRTLQVHNISITDAGNGHIMRTPLIPARGPAPPPGGARAPPPRGRPPATPAPGCPRISELRCGPRESRRPRGPPNLTTAAPSGEAAMHTGRSSARRGARSLLAENENTQTRSQALGRRSTRARGAMAGASFTSMLKRTPGQAPSRSSSTGIGSVPSMRAPAMSRWFRREIRPGCPVTRSSVRSWKATSTPSAVACASVSRYS